MTSVVGGSSGHGRRETKHEGKRRVVVQHRKAIDDDEEEDSHGSEHSDERVRERPKHAKERLRSKCERRFGGQIAQEDGQQTAQEWTYLKDYEVDRGTSHSRLERVSWTPLRESLCRQLFVGRIPPAKMSHGDSTFACVLTPRKEDGLEQALFLSDYNRERRLPNFVAFVAPVDADLTSLFSDDGMDTRHAIDGFDVAYSPGPVEECCWCSSAQADSSCNETAGKVGHLAPSSGIDSSAADVFMNTVPMRAPFAELQWSRRLQELLLQGQRLHAMMRGRRMHVLLGPSQQADGRVVASSGEDAEGVFTEKFVEVPSFLWAAYADPYAQAASGYVCRNGGADDECACVDGLPLRDLEERLGFHFFPGLASGDSRPEHTLHARPRRSSSLQRVLRYISISAAFVLVILALVCICKNSSRHQQSIRDDKRKRARLAEEVAKESDAAQSLQAELR
eukprot:CAMPEP_0169365158 /NCGR_PEP_ID=MMETSP1017-20121227/32401_1 /TAXON_ID=342587 /ORGANISM="Karlodinium micrum, Strain CCMP2283" /LENGTH=450 /DNA_ID=CAMNT_0009462943 /DNA_START=40 /DNA_END=1388 /DNA_ORIENTATION=+